MISTFNTAGRHIFLATTGESPQIVTETLYAIDKQDMIWPDMILLITTTKGKAKACDGLIQHNQLARLCSELNREIPEFSASHVLVIPDANDHEIDDARSLEDYEALGNFITSCIRDCTHDSESLHASLAGGRKTMTFFLGYAMSLFGRKSDTLSHVLISEGYEGIPDFWFPSKEQGTIKNRAGIALESAQAEVTLAPIPFIRHRNTLPELLLNSKQKNVNFSELVELINLAENPEHIHLTVDLSNRKIVIANKINHKTIIVDMASKPLDLAFYAITAKSTKRSENIDLIRPSGNDKNKFLHGSTLQANLVNMLLQIFNIRSKSIPIDNFYTTDPIKRTKLENEIEDLLFGQVKDNTLKVLQNPTKHTWFDNRVTDLNKLLNLHLPKQLSLLLTPSIILDSNGSAINDKKARKNGIYGFRLLPEQIEII